MNAFVRSHNDATKWEEYFASGVGQTLLELMAGMSSYFSYQNIVGRRECYFQNAQNRSSLIGAAQYLGYATFRGRNPVVGLSVLPNITMTIPAYSVVGSYQNYDLITQEEVTINAGIPNSEPINLVVGEMRTTSLTSNTSELTIFKFFQSGVSEDIQILFDGVVAEHSRNIKDLNKVPAVVLSNPYESVDIFSLNSITSPVRYSFNSNITLNYVALEDFSVNKAKLVFNYGEILNSEILSTYNQPEPTVNIKVEAPLYFETQFTVRGRNDVEKMVVLFSQDIIDAKGFDVSPAVISVSVLKRDTSALTDDERDSLVYRFEEIRQFGMAPPNFTDAIRVPVTIRVSVSLNPPSPSNLPEQISAIISQYEKKLGASLNFQDIEMAVEDLSGIKIARVSFSGTPWAADAKYQLGESSDNGKEIQVVKELIHYSGTTTPIWSSVVGDFVIDNKIKWVTEVFKDTPVVSWEANKNYELGKVVVSNVFIQPPIVNPPPVVYLYQYRAVEYLNYSGITEPSWPRQNKKPATDYVGILIYDNDLMWITLERKDQNFGWSPSVTYKIGDVVISVNDVVSNTENLMFQVVGYLGTTGSTQPTWTTVLGGTYKDGGVLWETRSKVSSPAALPYNQYYIITKIIETTL